MRWSSGAFLLAALVIAGCAREAGAPLGLTRTGALAANAAAQGGGRDSARVLALDAAFRAAADPVVNFAFDSARLDPGATGAVARQADWLNANPEAAVRVTGHADLVGASGYNHGLGRRRAEAVAAGLVARGISARRISAIVSRGEQDPVVPTPRRERLNRRVSTEVAWLGAAPEAFGLDGERAAIIYDEYQAGEVEAPDVVEAEAGAE